MLRIGHAPEGRFALVEKCANVVADAQHIASPYGEVGVQVRPQDVRKAMVIEHVLEIVADAHANADDVSGATDQSENGRNILLKATPR